MKRRPDTNPRREDSKTKRKRIKNFFFEQVEMSHDSEQNNICLPEEFDTKVINVRRTKKGFHFDVMISGGEKIIKNLFMPLNKIYDADTIKLKRRLTRKTFRRMKFIENFVIFPISLGVIVLALNLLVDFIIKIRGTL